MEIKNDLNGLSALELEFLEKFNDSFKICIIPLKCRNPKILKTIYVNVNDSIICQQKLLNDFRIRKDIFMEYINNIDVFVLAIMKKQATFFHAGDVEFSSSMIMLIDTQSRISQPMSERFIEICRILMNSNDTRFVPFENEESHAYYVELKESKKEQFTMYEYVLELNEQLTKDSK